MPNPHRPATTSLLRRCRAPLIAALLAASAALSLAAVGSEPLEKAIAKQRELAASAPLDPTVHSDLGNLLGLAGRDAEAQSAYEEALRLDPDFFEAHFNYAVLLLNLDQPRAALPHLEAAVMLEPSSAWSHYHLGTALRLTGHRRDAIRAYAEALRLEPRLGFTDVNPNIITNPLLTQAMLLANRNAAPRGATPRMYSEPSRIAALLVPQQVVVREPAPSPEPAPAPPDAAANEPRRLDESELRPTGAEPPTIEPPVDQGDELAEEPEEQDEPAAAPAATRTRQGSAAGNAQGQTLVPVPVPTERRRLGPADLNRRGTGNQVQPEGGGGGNRNVPTTRFRPGRRSSAQLDLLLLPSAKHVDGEASTLAAGS